MNDNVSINTFSVKFLKRQELEQNSLRNLLTKKLRQVIDLYRQTKDISIDLELIDAALDRKIVLLFAESSKIIYRCAIAFVLAKYFSLSPAIIARELVALLPLVGVEPTETGLEFRVTIFSAWIDFYWEELTLAAWLEETIANLNACPLLSLDSLPQNNPSTQTDLFFPQYVHTRCCSWLRLAERENLIELRDRAFTSLIWPIAQPDPIVWLDPAGRFYLTHAAESNLLFQLLTVVDKLDSQTENWRKIAFNLSKAMLVFEAQCRIFGAVKQNCPQRAIARLGSIALVQYFLHKLLTIKLGSVPFTEL
ncbi:hypothetical protein [Myxosarcina sp. GI1(2024)]